MGKLAFYILILSHSFAFAQDGKATHVEHVGHELGRLEVNPDVHQETGRVPGIEFVGATDMNHTIRVGLTNGFSFQLSMKDYGGSALANYETLPVQKRRTFLAARKWIMSTFATLLTGTFFLPGTYYVARDTAFFIGRNFEPVREFYREVSPPTPMTIFRDSSWANERANWTTPQKSYRDQMYEQYTRIMILLDEQLIRMAGLLNIYSGNFTQDWLDFAIVPGFSARGGRIGGGKTPPLYFSLGIDWKRRRILARVWGDNERSILGQSLSLPSVRIAWSRSGTNQSERSQKFTEGQNYQPWGPFSFTSTPDRTTMSVSYDLIALSGAFTASWVFGLDPVGVILTTLSSAFVPGYSWAMSSVGTITRAEFWEGSLTLDGQIYSRFLPGHEVLQGILGGVVSLLTHKSKESIGRLRAGYSTITSDPQGTVKKWRETRTFASTAAPKSCLLSLNLNTSPRGNE